MFKSVFPPQRALVTITFEGEAIQVEEGTTVAAAVLDRAGGETRTTARKHDGRGPYCHMGVCYECLMEIDGVPKDVYKRQTPIRSNCLSLFTKPCLSAQSICSGARGSCSATLHFSQGTAKL